MQITNSTNSYLTSEVNSTKLAAATITADKQSTAEETVSKSFDTFEYSEAKESCGIYSANAATASTSSVSSGKELYNKLNGKTVYVSYINGSKNNAVTINLSEVEMNALYSMCSVAGVEPSMALAVIAHESMFNKDATSSTGACGLMQVQAEYYEENLTRYNNVYYIAKSSAGIGDDIKNDPYNVYGNMAAGVSALKYWKNYYSEEEMLKGYAQGFKSSGWTTYANNADSEIRAVKAQIDAMLA